MFWKTVPPMTLAIPGVILVGSITFFITCMAMFVQFQCFLMDYSALMPGAIFLKGQVWRLLTPHLVPATLWQVFFVMFSFVPPAFVLEKKVGSLRFAGLLAFCAMFTSLFTSAVAALLYYIPGINRWSYFRNQWFSTSDLGPTSLLLFVLICSTRAFTQRTVPFFFSQIPSWAYILITYVFAQLMMYPPWYGVVYNLGAVIGAFLFPKMWLHKDDEATVNEMFAQFAATAKEGGQEPKGVEMQDQKPYAANGPTETDTNSRVPKQTVPVREEGFTARGRTL